MKIKNLNNQAFSHIEAILILVVFVIIGGIGYVVYNKHNTSHAGGLAYKPVGTISFAHKTFYIQACIDTSKADSFNLDGQVIVETPAGGTKNFYSAGHSGVNFNPLVTIKIDDSKGNPYLKQHSDNWNTNAESRLIFSYPLPVADKNFGFNVAILGYVAVTNKPDALIEPFVSTKDIAISTLKDCGVPKVTPSTSTSPSTTPTSSDKAALQQAVNAASNKYNTDEAIYINANNLYTASLAVQTGLNNTLTTDQAAYDKDNAQLTTDQTSYNNIIAQGHNSTTNVAAASALENNIIVDKEKVASDNLKVVNDTAAKKTQDDKVNLLFVNSYAAQQTANTDHDALVKAQNDLAAAK